MHDAWAVLSLFLIPVGGGIPAGVLLAKSQGMAWPVTAGLYFISDVILACVLEPLMLGLIFLGRNSERITRTVDAFRRGFQMTAARFGHRTGPLALIGIAFGVDPMTGRAVAAIAGHRFLTGWALAIAGDMIYFAVIMISTLWLDGVLGNGTATTVIILALMFFVPWAVKKFRTGVRA